MTYAHGVPKEPTPLNRLQSSCWSCLMRSLRFCSSSPSDSSPSSMDSSPSSFSLGIGSGGGCGVLDLLFFLLLLLPPASAPESDSPLTGERCLLFLLDFFLCLLLLEPPPPPLASESLSTMEGGDPSPDSDKSFLRFFFFGLEDWEGEEPNGIKTFFYVSSCSPLLRRRTKMMNLGSSACSSSSCCAFSSDCHECACRPPEGLSHIPGSRGKHLVNICRKVVHWD